MKVNGRNYKTVWYENGTVKMIDQHLLPFKFAVFSSRDYKATSAAIKSMKVRGAGAIGAAAGFAMAQAFRQAPKSGESKFFAFAEKARREIRATRPTAVDLFYAVDLAFSTAAAQADLAAAAKAAELAAQKYAFELEEAGKKIGEHGSKLVRSGSTIQTHCNAGWLAFVDWGSALAPVYYAKRQGKKVFVLVDETRPRLQGARLTAWELSQEKIAHKIIPDGAAASFLQKGETDLVIVGADHIAANGDVANKIGTLPLAIAAKYFGVPFYVAAPLSTFDFSTKTGKGIRIEERGGEEVSRVSEGASSVRLSNPSSPVANPAFDVTPAKLVFGFVTPKGIFTPASIRSLLR